MADITALFGKNTSGIDEVVDDLNLIQDSPVLPTKSYGADANISKLSISILPIGEVDLRPSFQKLEVYENIFASSLQGTIDFVLQCTMIRPKAYPCFPRTCAGGTFNGLPAPPSPST